MFSKLTFYKVPNRFLKLFDYLGNNLNKVSSLASLRWNASVFTGDLHVLVERVAHGLLDAVGFPLKIFLPLFLLVFQP